MIKYNHAMEEEEMMTRVVRKLDRLLRNLDRLEDKIDDVHDHLHFIMDAMFGPEEEEEAMPEATATIAKLKKDEPGKVYSA